MTLTLDTNFEDFHSFVLQDQESCEYREVYKAMNKEGKEVRLILYLTDRLPACYPDRKFNEFNISCTLHHDAFPHVFQRDTCIYHDENIEWMASEWIDGKSLGEWMTENKAMEMEKALPLFLKMLYGIKELAIITGGGGHYNITPYHIILRQSQQGKTEPIIIGMEHAACPCNGSTPFETKTLDALYRAPETFMGKYSQISDVYALGLILAYMLQGTYPWKMEDREYSSEQLRQLKRTAPELHVPESLKNIIFKAIAPKPSCRYKSIDELIEVVKVEMGFGNIHSLTNCDSSDIHRQTEEMNMENFSTQAKYEDYAQSAMPKTTVRIETVKGGGFEDVAGMDELKGKLSRNFISIIKHRDLASTFHITPPNGILLWGPPGNGKTYISRKLAEESGLQFSMVQPSDLGSIYIHGSQSMIADLFAKSEEMAAKNKRGVLLVFDEFDSLVPRRDAHDDKQANEVAEFLTRLNDCANKNVYVVATTNRIDAIDPAIIRKGRMDEVIYVGLPDEMVRKELFEIELNQRPHEDICIEKLVAMTKGYSSSDISYVVKETARMSFEASLSNKDSEIVKISQAMLENTIRHTRPSVTQDELHEYENAKEKYMNFNKKEHTRIGFNV